MEQKLILRTGFLFLIIASIAVCIAEESSDTKNAEAVDASPRPFGGPFRPLMRRRIVRKRIFDGENSANVTNVSVSMSVSRVQSDAHTDDAEPVQSGGALRRPFGKFRPAFGNRTRPLFSEFKPTMEPRETPSVSFREFRLTMRPRLGFGRRPTTPATTTTDVEAEIDEDTQKPTTTMKPFPVKKLLRGKPKRVTTTSTTEDPVVEEDNEADEEQAEDDDSTNEVDGPEPEEESQSEATPAEVTTSTTSTSTAPTTTTVETTTEQATTSTATVERPSKNSSMIIIPVPPSQRKPYHPVIMQVTKTPTTAESLPETKVVTYKLNKMFVPMGIYGKVLPKSASQSDFDVTTENSIVSTPLPFLLPGQENGKRKNSGKNSPTPSPDISVKVKGHRSKEVEDTMTSGDTSSDFASAVAYASSQKEHHERQQKQWESMMTKLKQKQRNLADSVSLTYQKQRKPNIQDISLTTERVDVAKISLTTEESLNFEGTRQGQGQTKWTGYNSMSAPRPFRPHQQSPPKTIMGTLASAASSIPGLIHEGFTSVISGYGNAFEDEARFPGQSEPPNFVAAASDSQSQITSPPSPDNESLEYFRKRPHLLNKKNRGKSNFLPPEYSSGFKPVTAPPHFASQYYASTPKHPTPFPFVTSTTAAAVDKKQREPLYQANRFWQTEAPAASSLRNAKQFLSMNDLAAWKAAVLRNSEPETKGFSFSSTTPGYSRPVSSTPKSFAEQWFEFNKKYSRNEIEDAKDKIYTMFSESRSDPYDDLMYMKPPGEFKHGQTNAFDDLLKMFKLGFSFGAGHSGSKKPMVSYAAGMHADDTQHAASGDGWRPLTKPGGSPMISFNAGVTIGGKPTSTPAYTGFGGGSHFSSSTKPFIPKSKYQDHFNGNKGYSHALSANELPTKYHGSSLVGLKPSPTPDYLSNIYYGNLKTGDADDVSETSKHNRFEINPAISTHFTPSSTPRPAYTGFDRNKLDAVLGSMKYVNDQAIEIIPSSEFFKQKGNMADIAAVIKPPELSDELVKAALPPQISAVPQLSYPTQQLIQNPQGFTSLSQLQQYFATAQPTPYPTQPFNQIIPQQHFQQYPQQQLFFHHGGFVPQGAHPQQFVHIRPTQQPQQHQQHPQQHLQHSQQHLQHSQQQQQQPQQQIQISAGQQQSSHGTVKSAGESGVGFSDFELPAGVDPDIASLLQAELSKDDIPEEYRKDFIEAQEQEKKKQEQQQQQASASRLRVTVIKPGQKMVASKRMDHDRKPEIKFHKPIPISPTMLTPTKGKPIRASPVPRYVVELARKLKTDKEVQGIVRVSTKRNRGPPIEYLYPVRG